MEDLRNLGGRPRQYPPCPRYGAHRFGPKSNRCPCGYQRPGTVEPPAKRNTIVLTGVRLDAAAYRTLQELSGSTGKSIAELVRLAIDRMIAEDLPQAF